MPFDRTVNYKQNVPKNLEFNNFFAPTPDRIVKVLFILDPTYRATPKMGRIVFPVTDGVTIEESRRNTSSSWKAQYNLSGNVTQVNAALNACQYVSHYYEIDDTAQDFLSVTRSPGNYHGELCLQVSDEADISTLSINSAILLSQAPQQQYYYLVTRIDNTPNQKRIWCMYRNDYNMDDLYNGSKYKLVALGDQILTYNGAAFIATITDFSYQNPYGNWNMSVTTTDAVEEANTIRLVGSPYLDEPVFTTDPPSAFAAPTPDTWYSLSLETLPWAVITQPANNFQSIQLLIKAYENDPKYIGATQNIAPTEVEFTQHEFEQFMLPEDIFEENELVPVPTEPVPEPFLTDQQLLDQGAAIDNLAGKDIATYITDDTYGLFSDVQVGSRVSVSPRSGPVRWHFYGTPTDCNTAFKRISYYRPSGFTKDFKIETRIVNNRVRIYRDRGQ